MTYDLRQQYPEIFDCYTEYRGNLLGENIDKVFAVDLFREYNEVNMDGKYVVMSAAFGSNFYIFEVLYNERKTEKVFDAIGRVAMFRLFSNGSRTHDHLGTVIQYITPSEVVHYIEVAKHISLMKEL